jgi:hypothetical protein
MDLVRKRCEGVQPSKRIYENDNEQKLKSSLNYIRSTIIRK